MVPTRSIDEGSYVSINGIEQWITVRGSDRRNPVLLWLHGGPGLSMSWQAPLFFEWEHHFTIVQWDQPGGGATAARNVGDPGELTIERYVRDAIAVIEWVCSHLGTNRVVIMGVSWGALLGLELTHRRPDLIAAHIGTGQFISGLRGTQLGYDMALQDARDRADESAIAELEKAGPPPYKKYEDFLTHLKYASSQRRTHSVQEAEALAAASVLLAEPPPADARYVAPITSPEDPFETLLSTLRIMFPQMSVWEAEERVGLEFAVPMFFIQGEHDHSTPTPVVRDFVDRIQAPMKELITIPDVGHTTVALHEHLLFLLNRHIRPHVEHQAAPAEAS